MQLFYHPEVTPEDQKVVFAKEESKHIIKVLRKRLGDSLDLTNGKGGRFRTEITEASPTRCAVKILSSELDPPPAYHLHLAVAPTKMNDRYEWFLEKATEIGIQEITPIFCDHSERKSIKKDRYERVIQSAMKQSLHTHFPVLNEGISFMEFLNQEREGQKFIAHCEEDQEKTFLFPLIKTKAKVHIIVGPEGDFSKEEILCAKERNWVPVSLGSTRLRTETAAVVACHSVCLKNDNDIL